MENFYPIYESEEHKFRVFINFNDKEVLNKFHEINRDETLLKKFTLVIEAVKDQVANRSQYNHEVDFPVGKVYAIKVNKHRFYTLQVINSGYRELFICRYGKKESQQNTKKLTDTIQSIDSIGIKKGFDYE